MANERLDPLITRVQIERRVQELAKEINAAVPTEGLILIGILKGSLHFLADLSRQLPPSCEIDFLQVSSYRGHKSSTGVVQIRKDLDISIEGRNVLIVEDIIDTGITLTHVLEFLSTRRPNSVRVVAMLSKCKAKGVDVAIDFVGFEIPDEFVVGYGLDFGERYRGLPDISILRDSVPASS